MSLGMRLRALLPPTLSSWVKVARARVAESLGFSWWQMPALHGLDVQMLERLPEVGTFLEVGGHDGYSYSNTYYLERHRNWRGILIEPLATHRIAARHRRGSVVFNRACVGPDGPAIVRLVDRGPMAVSLGMLDCAEEARRVGGVERVVEAPTATISSLIDQSGLTRITFMVIDVEGAEMHVLAGLELRRHTPDFLLIETDRLDEVTCRLAGHMQYEAALSHHDHLFVRA